MSHANSTHDEKCHCARCRPLERPCDCEWCRDYRTKNKPGARLRVYGEHPENTERVEVLNSCMEHPQVLVFVDRDGTCQKCQDCWFNWFDTELCQVVPCNSQGRTDGRVGTWQEPGRSKCPADS